jgi:hypothetical protein
VVLPMFGYVEVCSLIYFRVKLIPEVNRGWSAVINKLSAWGGPNCPDQQRLGLPCSFCPKKRCSGL